MAIAGVHHGSEESVIIYHQGGGGGKMAGLRIWLCHNRICLTLP